MTGVSRWLAPIFLIAGTTAALIILVGAQTPHSSSVPVVQAGPALPDLTVTKADSADPVDTGQAFTYTIEVRNAGSAGANPVLMRDTLPGIFTVSGITTTRGSCSQPSSDIVECSVGPLATGPGAFATITITGTVVKLTDSKVTNTAEVDPDGTVAESNEANNVDVETTQVRGPTPTPTATPTPTPTPILPDLTVTKVDSPDPVDSGQTITYTIQARNIGNATATFVRVLDTLPANFALRSFSTDHGSCGVGSPNVVDCDLSPLQADAVGTITITGAVTTQADTTVTNQVEVDPYNKVQERDETNNVAEAATLVRGPGISAGGLYTCALNLKGGAWCWGENFVGELGDGTTTNRTTPVDVCATDSVPFCASVKSNTLGDAAAVAAGWRHTCAFTMAGDVKCWGASASGQLGDGRQCGGTCAVPVDVCADATCTSTLNDAAAVTSGGLNLVLLGHTCALSLASSVRCWGYNGRGQLGDETTTTRTTPVEVVDLGSGVAAVDAGGVHTCALTTAGGVKCWGDNSVGQLGAQTAEMCQSSPCSTVPLDVAGLSTGVIAITAGDGHTCALTTAGGVKCWGNNQYGQVGDGQNCGTACPVPTDVVGLESGVAAIAAGGSHTCALTNGGGVKCWGWNDVAQGGGQLGDGTTTNRTTPVDVCAPELSPPCQSLLSGVAAVSAGGEHTCARMAAGGFKCWGYNNYGQLGDGTTTTRTTPVDVLFDSDRDGCTDIQEGGGNPALGGGRNPQFFWDFFDVPTPPGPARNRAIVVADISAVIARFGSARPGGPPSKAEAFNEALAPPPPAPAYHAAYDRTPAGLLTGSPDGAITVIDINRVVAQFGHSCL